MNYIDELRRVLPDIKSQSLGHLEEYDLLTLRLTTTRRFGAKSDFGDQLFAENA